MIDDLIKKLPEVYQNIYGHPEYKPSRDCSNRERMIDHIVKAYKKVTGKSEVSILDIGCAQGYYSLKLAEAGNNVTGIDFNPLNIAVCQALSREACLPIDFRCEEIAAQYFTTQKYDIIIALSVYHHIALKGYGYAKGIFDKMCKAGNVIITELALKEEGYYWSANLPTHYQEWLDANKFYKEIAFTDTHLTSVKRPFIFISKEYVYCGGQMYLYSSFTNKSYKEGFDLPYKNLYFHGDTFCKIAHRSPLNAGHSDYMYNETEREIINLLDYNLSWFPQLLSYEITPQYALCVQKINQGVLLYDLIKQRGPLKPSILYDVLDNLIELEANGLYHNDVRTWNVVITSHKAFLIDIGSITGKNEDCCGGMTNTSFVKLLDWFLTPAQKTAFTLTYRIGMCYSDIKRILQGVVND